MECDQHIERMTKDRTMRIARDRPPNGRRKKDAGTERGQTD